MQGINFPIIKFMDNDKYIASVEKVFTGDKRLIYTKSKFNSDFDIIDSEGNLFRVNKLIPQNFSLWFSITLIGIMYELTPDYRHVKVISLNDAKERVWSHVSKNKSFWSSINDGRGLRRMIYEAEDFKELIMMFR